jgi:hypothetical protein
MAKKSYAYDDPAYRALVIAGGPIATGSAVSFKYAAFTAMLVKSVTISPTTAGTAADVCSLHKISGTTTTTQALCTFTAVLLSTNIVPTTPVTLAEGDVIAVAKGADATGVYACAVELQLVPGANVTV